MTSFNRSGVYSIVNTVSKKRYVGSSFNVKGRVNGHLSALKNNNHPNKHIQSSWNKYGAKAFKIMILEYCENCECISREQYWIDAFKSYLPTKGYNQSPTAGRTTGYKMPPAVLAVVTANNRRTKADPVVRRKLSEASKRNWDNPLLCPKLAKANKYRITP